MEIIAEMRIEQKIKRERLMRSCSYFAFLLLPLNLKFMATLRYVSRYVRYIIFLRYCLPFPSSSISFKEDRGSIVVSALWLHFWGSPLHYALGGKRAKSVLIQHHHGLRGIERERGRENVSEVLSALILASDEKTCFYGLNFICLVRLSILPLLISSSEDQRE